VDDGGLVSIAVLGKTSTDPKCHLIAVKALENVSKTPEFVRFMIQEGTLEIVTMVLGHKTLSNSLVALRTLLNMAKPELTRSKICSVDLLKSLERFVSHDELSVQVVLICIHFSMIIVEYHPLLCSAKASGSSQCSQRTTARTRR
jgi:hypothetical protein